MVMSLALGLGLNLMPFPSGGAAGPPELVSTFDVWTDGASTVSLAKPSPNAGELGIVIVSGIDRFEEPTFDDEWIYFERGAVGYYDNAYTHGLYYRVMDGTETSGNWDWVWATADPVTIMGGLFKNCDPNFPIQSVAHGPLNQGASASPDAFGVTTVQDNSLLVSMLSAQGGRTATDPVGMTALLNDVHGTPGTLDSWTHGMSSLEVESAADTGDKTWTLSTADQFMCVSWALNPVLGVTPPRLIAKQYQETATADLSFTFATQSSVGDVGVIVVSCDSNITFTTPSGWTVTDNTSGASAACQQAIYSKVLDADDISGGVIVDWTGNQECQGFLMVFTECGGVPDAKSTVFNPAAQDTVVIDGVTTIENGSLCIGCVTVDAERVVDDYQHPEGVLMLSLNEITAGTGVSTMITLTYQETAGVVADQTINISASDESVGIMLSLPPA